MPGHTDKKDEFSSQTTNDLAIIHHKKAEALKIEMEAEYAEALRLFKLAAKDGDHEAQYNLGSYYRYGLGTNEDLTTALYWLNLSAQAGIDRAKNDLEEILTMTKSDSDKEREEDLEVTSRLQDIEWTLMRLKNPHNKDYITKEELDEMIKFLKLAAEEEIESAIDNLALCYQNGWGVEKNLSEADRLFALSESKKKTDNTTFEIEEKSEESHEDGSERTENLVQLVEQKNSQISQDEKQPFILPLTKPQDKPKKAPKKMLRNIF